MNVQNVHPEVIFLLLSNAFPRVLQHITLNIRLQVYKMNVFRVTQVAQRVHHQAR